MQIEKETVENYEKRLSSAGKQIDALCAENSRIRLELLRVQAENERLKAVIFPPQLEYKKVGGFKVYGE